MSGTENFGETVGERGKQYESPTFAHVHRDIFHLFPTTPSQVIDIGAGMVAPPRALPISAMP